MSALGYTKRLSVTIQRTKHRIGFQSGCTVGHLIELLKKVPLEATVDEVFCDSGDDRISPDITIIEFHEEVRSE
jgi:hypothetical protein